MASINNSAKLKINICSFETRFDFNKNGPKGKKKLSQTLPRKMQFPRLKKILVGDPRIANLTFDYYFRFICNFFFRLYLSLGLTKAALEIALKLEMWETVIDCYHRIDLKHKAAEVIQNKINTNGKSFYSYEKI